MAIRNRLKARLRRAAVKLLHMEFQVEEQEQNYASKERAGAFDPSVIPKVVDGSGDTPGPNHKRDIGRTWLAAQLIGGVSPFLLDVRRPAEVAAGMIPGALLLPGDLVKRHLDLLPSKDTRVTVYDQTGEQDSGAVADWLRRQGWTLARRLQGGFAEWIEHDEPIANPKRADADGPGVGDPVELTDGRKGWVLWAEENDGAVRYTVWFETGETIGPLSANELQP